MQLNSSSKIISPEQYERGAAVPDTFVNDGTQPLEIPIAQIKTPSTAVFIFPSSQCITLDCKMKL